MEKMKQKCKVKKPLKIWQGVLTLLVSAVILFVAAPILLSPFGMYGYRYVRWLLSLVFHLL
mgnify:CR=1 FL=1